MIFAPAHWVRTPARSSAGYRQTVQSDTDRTIGHPTGHSDTMDMRVIERLS